MATSNTCVFVRAVGSCRCVSAHEHHNATQDAAVAIAAPRLAFFLVPTVQQEPNPYKYYYQNGRHNSHWVLAQIL